MKNPVSTIVAIALAGGLIWWLQAEKKVDPRQHSSAPEKRPVQIVENSNTETIVDTDEMPVLFADQDKTATAKVPTEETPKQPPAENQTNAIYDQLFQIAGMKDGYVENVTPGEPISVSNFYDANVAALTFLPLGTNGKISAVAILRQTPSGEKELFRMRDVTQDWVTYPPIDVAAAQYSLLAAKPHLAFDHVPGYYHLEGRETPFYLFENDAGSQKHFYLVSALDSNNIKIKQSRQQTVKQANNPVRVNASGLIEIDELKAGHLTEGQLQQLREDIKATNESIRQGMMKYDKDMNLLFDKRAD